MKERPQSVLLDISWVALVKVLIFIIGLWAIYLLRDVILMLFGVFIFMAAVNPTITRWQKKMSRLLAVSLFYALMLAVLALVSSLFVPQLLHQINELLRTLPKVLDKIGPFFNGLQPSGGSQLVDQIFSGIKSTLNSASNGVLTTAISLFGGLATIVTGVVISFYLLLEENNARNFFHQILPQHRFEAVYHTLQKISDRMGSWVRGQVLLMLLIGASNFLAYLIIGISAPLPLAIWAGLCEVIPFIGPTLGLIPAVIIALTTGSLLQVILLILIGYLIIQQLEAHIVVPKVMGRAVGLSPVLVIIALIIGDKLLGLFGAIIAVPIAAIISVVVGEWSELRKIWEGSG